MPWPEDYWASYEETVSTLGEYLEAVQTISAYQAIFKTKFAWRGVADAGYPLYSRLVRAYEREATLPVMERQLQVFERRIIREAREWGLDWRQTGGRLSALELLASLQHFGAPTRLLDFTMNPLVALWFAVERGDSAPGRVIAVDVSNRRVSRRDAALSDPWWFRSGMDAAVTAWTTESRAWLPPPLEARIARQEACFLVGGIPTTTPPRNVHIRGKWRPMTASEVRFCMSLPFSLISYRQATAQLKNRKLAGKPPQARAFTLKIENKASLLADLERAFGYSRRSLFPDLPGFAEFGESFPKLKSAIDS